MAKRLRGLGSSATAAVERLRAAAQSLPFVVESVTFGNPTFRVGHKAIAVVDRYDDRECLWLRVSPEERDQLLKEPGWFRSPYDPKQVALCCDLSHVDWRGIKRRLRQSYDLAQSKKARIAK
jgi:predicted DNA-binding protein (MmcQ/YjbR family)